MAKWVSIAPSLYTVWDVEIVNASMVSRGGGGGPSVTSPAGKSQAHFPLHPLSNPKQGESHNDRDAPSAVY